MKPSDLVTQVQPGDGSWFRLLATEMLGTGSEAKYFLVKLLREHQWQQCPTQTVGDWAAKFGMTARAVSLALTELMDGGCIALESLGGHQPGRPKQRLSLKPKVNELLRGALPVEKRKGPHSHIYPPIEPRRHDALINHLFEQDVAKGVPVAVGGKNSRNQALLARQHPLGFAGRLLLGVLLSFADEYGVVSHLGRGDLARLTGMNKGRVDSQIEMLKKYGYIRKAVPGISVGNILGVQPGMIILNLKHWAFGACAYKEQTVLFKEMKYVMDGCHLRVAERLIEQAGLLEVQVRQRLASQRQPLARKDEEAEKEWERSKVYEGLASAMVASDDMGHSYQLMWKELVPMLSCDAKNYLQMKVDLYASLLLTKHWKKIKVEVLNLSGKHNDSDFLSGTNIDKIILDDLFVSNMGVNGTIKTLPSINKVKDAFAKVLRSSAINTAILAKNIIDSSGVPHDEKNHYLIISPLTSSKNKTSHSVSIDILSGYQNEGKCGCLMLTSNLVNKINLYDPLYKLAIVTPEELYGNQWEEVKKTHNCIDSFIQCGLLSEIIDKDLYKSKIEGVF